MRTLIVGLGLVVADVAAAQDPTRKGYGGQPEQANPDGGAGLPFTGFDLVLLAGAGIVLLVLGLALRRFARERPTSS